MTAARAAAPPRTAAVIDVGSNSALLLVVRLVGEAFAAEAVVVSDHGVRHAYLAARCAECGIEADLRALWS